MTREERQAACIGALNLQEDRVRHFQQRCAELGRAVADTCVVLLSVDCPVGGPLARALMPDNEAEWDALRESGAQPYARGLATREGVAGYLEERDPETAKLLRDETELPVVLIDHQMVIVAALQQEPA